MIQEVHLEKIVSGGQTGADRAALDWAIEHDMPHGGWCPKGRKAEDGVLHHRYRLTETESEGYRQRTRANVRDSDGTLVVNLGPLEGGTRLTVEFAEKEGRPCLVLQMDEGSVTEHVERLRDWLLRHDIRVLNVAGPRASKQPAVYQRVLDLLDALGTRPGTVA